MSTDPHEESLREGLVALVARLTGDQTLAEDVTQQVLLDAQARSDDADALRADWAELRVMALQLAARRLRARGALVPLALEVEALGIVWPGAPSLAEAERVVAQFVAAALERLPSRQRMALDLVDLDGYSLEEAAERSNVDAAQFRRLVSRARRRLLSEYRKLTEEDLAGLGMLAWLVDGWRRLRRALQRSYGNLADQVAVKWAELDPVRVLNTVAASAAANLSMAVVVAGSVGVLSATDAPAARERGSRPAAVNVVAWAPAAQASAVTAWTERVRPAATTGLRPPADTTAETHRADEVTKQTIVGPVSKSEYPEQGVTAYTVETPPPAPPPEELAPSVEAPLPLPVAPPPPALPDTGVGDRPTTVKTGYDCPPPDERPLPHTVICPLVNS